MISVEHLGPPSIKIVGFQLWVHGIDGESWLRVTAHCGEKGADVWTSGSILRLDDVISLRDGCQNLLNANAEEFHVSPCEPDIALACRKVDSLGHYDFRVKITPDQMTQKHEFKFAIDQSYLRQTISECQSILATFHK